LFQHANELIEELKAAGVQPTPQDDEVVEGGEEDEEEWVDEEGDVEMED